MNSNNQQVNKITVDEIISATKNFENVSDNVFMEALDSKNESTVWWAVKGAGLKKIKKAVPKLVELLGKPALSLGNTDVRMISALALSQIGFDNFIEYLINIDKNPNYLIREGFADVLGLTRDSRALPFLDKLMEDENKSVLLWASLSLSKLGEISIPVIKKHLFNTNDLKKIIYLLDSLKKIGSSRTKKVIEDYLNQTEFKELKNKWTSLEDMND